MSATASLTAIKLKHILVATDLSPASLWSLPYVTAIARQYDATVYMAHVIPLGTYVAARPQSFDAIEEECRKTAQEKLDTFSAGVRKHGIQVQTLLTEGDVGVVLPDWIKKHDIDLVAVGTTGRSGVRKLVLGSIAEEIIREADCPVLTVGPASSDGSPVTLRSILYATDFSADSLQAAMYALSIAVHHDARLIVLHVRDEPGVEESKASLARRLHDLIPKDSNLAAKPEVLVAEGRPTKKILEIASEHSVDLIVIGVRGGGEFPRAASHFGSTAHDIIVRASCPVLTVRAPQQN